MLFQVAAHIKFLLKSTNQHGVHSPFVFDLVTKCFYDKTDYPEYQVLKSYREQFSHNHEIIEITDFGAGSRVMNSNKRVISKMAKIAGITPKRAELLYRLVNYFQPYVVLELGTLLGLSTSALHLGNSNASIISLEGCKNTLAVTKEHFQTTFSKDVFEHVSFINTEFDSFLEEADLSFLTERKEDYSLVYFDGNHSKEATLRYLVKLLPTITEKTIWVFDDIHWSKDMEGAWDYIKELPEVTVTIDTFEWGLVFFRKEQAKQHFTIRVN